MGAFLDTTQAAVMATLVGYLRLLLPSGATIVQGQVNRVASPRGANFVVLTPLFKAQVEWVAARYAEAEVEGSISGTTMTVTSINRGRLAVGLAVAGDDVLAGTFITSVISGTPGAEQYGVNQSQTVAAGTLWAGSVGMFQPTEITVQADCFGPDSGDWAQMIVSAWQTQFSCEALLLTGIALQPLYTNGARQTPFTTGEQQTNDRYTVDLVMQANVTATLPQQFAGSAAVGLIEVDTTYPA